MLSLRPTAMTTGATRSSSSSGINSMSVVSAHASSANPQSTMQTRRIHTPTALSHASLLSSSPHSMSHGGRMFAHPNLAAVGTEMRAWRRIKRTEGQMRPRPTTMPLTLQIRTMQTSSAGQVNAAATQSSDPVSQDTTSTAASSTPSTPFVRIGDVTLPIGAGGHSRPDLIPCGYLANHGTEEEMDQDELELMRWMMQKIQIGQDFFLLGPPGPSRRLLILRLCELLGREVEFLQISRDTTESDLKQRAEVVAGGNLVHIDQPPVKAALHGRILILDGLHHAERNVLPTLNNLLENREMSLDDGHFIMSARSYDRVRQREGLTVEKMSHRKLLRAHPDFQVVALGLPVPRFVGYPLDPPLRSRFQCRTAAIEPSSLDEGAFESWSRKHSGVERDVLAALVAARETMRIMEHQNTSLGVSGNGADNSMVSTRHSRLPHFPSSNLEHLLRQLSLLPPSMQVTALSASDVHRVYPWALLMHDHVQMQTVLDVLDRFGIERSSSAAPSSTDKGQSRNNPSSSSSPSSSSKQTANVTVAPFDLHGQAPKLWLKSLTSFSPPTHDRATNNSEELVVPPSSLVSTPQQTVQLASSQRNTIPMSMQQMPSNAASSSNTSTSSTAHPLPTRQYRLPQGKRLRVTLTTTCMDDAPIQISHSASPAPPTAQPPNESSSTECTIELMGGPELPSNPSMHPSDTASPPSPFSPGTFICTSFHRRLLAPLLLDLASNRPICLLGARGCGKSAFIRYLVREVLGYSSSEHVHFMYCFKDMSTRDLIQRRTTDTDGNTIWTSSALINAALTGGVVILDGIDRLPAGTLQALRRMLEDRDLNLSDGSRLVAHQRYQKLLEKYPPEVLMNDLRIYPVLPSFRIIALATPPSQAVGGSGSGVARSSAQPNWLVEETLPLFSFHSLPEMNFNQRTEILCQLFRERPREQVVEVVELLEELSAGSCSESMKDNSAKSKNASPSPSPSPSSNVPSSSPFHFSLRSCIHLLQHWSIFPSAKEMESVLRRHVLYEFLPLAQRRVVDEMIEEARWFQKRKGEANESRVVEALASSSPAPVETEAPLRPIIQNNRLHIGDISYPIQVSPKHPELVPHILFYDIPAHLRILQDLLKEWIVEQRSTNGHDHANPTSEPLPSLPRRHLLLIGNQGVGKNKLVDRLLELLSLEREYIQLHRDSSVASLTIAPVLHEGRVRYEDSALVRAVRHGRVLVVDEVDKAPLEVVAVLRGLVQDGQMELADGRLICADMPNNLSSLSPASPSSSASPASISAHSRFVPIHPDFRLILLANRPGFPFLGQDFWRDNSDVYAAHSIPNPDRNSELELLRSYGPSVPATTLERLIDVFDELRHLVIEGTFSYPYSTRELVAITKHIQAFPQDGLVDALGNVVDFDAFDVDALRNLRRVFERHGLPLKVRHGRSGSGSGAMLQLSLAKAVDLPTPKLKQTWRTGPGQTAHIAANPTSGSNRGLATNRTSAGHTSVGSNASTNTRSSRFFSSFSAAFAPTSSVASSPSIPPAALPSALSHTTLSGRSWLLHLASINRSIESFENARIHRFTEQKATWKVPLPSGMSRPLDLVTLDDDSVHVLTSHPLTLHTYFPRHRHSVHALPASPTSASPSHASIPCAFHRHLSLDLDDFLPMYEVDPHSVRMVSITPLRTILLYVASHAMLLMFSFDKAASIALGSSPSGHTTTTSSSDTGPKAVCTMMTLQAPHGDKNLSASFLNYLTPGFKMPRWQSRMGQEKDAPRPFELIDSLSSHGLLFFIQPQSRFFMMLDLAYGQSGREGRGNKSQKQLSTQPTIAITKMDAPSKAQLTVIDLNDVLASGQGSNASSLTAAHIETLVALSPTMFIIETSDARRLVSAGPSDGWKWRQLSTSDPLPPAAETTASSSSSSSSHSSSAFVAHEQGWTYTPVQSHHVAEQQHGQHAQQDDDDSPSTSISISTSSAISSIPSADAIFIPRHDHPNPSSNPGNTEAPTLYRFASGRLFAQHQPRTAATESNNATNDTNATTNVWEVPLPSADSLPTAEGATSTECQYDVSMATMLPHSAQLAMPAYVTHHLPPLTAEPSTSQPGHYVSQYQQACLALVDLATRRIRHVIVPPHHSDLAASPSSSSSSSSSDPVSIDRFSRMGSSYSVHQSTFRSRRDQAEQSLDVENEMDEHNQQDATSSPTIPPPFSWARDRLLSLRELPQSGDLVTLSSNGRVRIWEACPISLGQSSSEWRKLFGLYSAAGGKGGKQLRLELKSDRKKDSKGPKEGKIDPKNTPHVGGNTWKGGTGGSDTAGLGGKGGPYRFDAGLNVHQMSDEEKRRIPQHLLEAARELGRRELAKRLQAIDMGTEEHQLYTQLLSKVSPHVSTLRRILELSESRHVEREWLRNQREGDLDDSKLIDALTGEKMVYRKRGVPTSKPLGGNIQRLPKRMCFVLDVSGSMYRFNGMDQRLERLLEATLLIMESFAGFGAKFSYAIQGHSGDSPRVPFVEYGSEPKDRKERLKVLQRMYVHTQFCSSGDHTLEAIGEGIKSVTKEEADDYLTIVVSDANLRRYGISPHDLSSALTSDPRVQSFIIFIASMADEAQRIMPHLPRGKAFFAAETAQLPNLFREILTSHDIVAL